MIVRLTMAAAALALMAAPALAQDYSQDPTYGTLNVTTGFIPDPAVIPVIAGGGIDASSLGGGCVGYIADAPDFRLNYVAGTDFPLIISALGEMDTTLVVNAADGSWHCNDDSDELNPAITFASPASGQYDIWVGTYDPAATGMAGLYISEVTTGAQSAGGMSDH